ncbi:uncharacterized protein LOC121389493 [Gigantopelta aegis]|uniref:uncharacterized protein LOC121389493 n=1 Tax=Gigantopelta aegis TaxID=1735272 RepID=UPI001B889F5C|nr:uncharacterized protein LOC121389493 [Gigantopelta aegis]
MNSLTLMCVFIASYGAIGVKLTEGKHRCTDVTDSFYNELVPYSKALYDEDKAKIKPKYSKAISASNRKVRGKLRATVNCPAPDAAALVGVTRRKRQVDDVNCDGCPVNREYLYKFHNNACFVILPNLQRVSYAICGNEACQVGCACCRCGEDHCSRHRFVKMWFFAFCFRSAGKWRPFFNYNYLWLPQDCKCK